MALVTMTMNHDLISLFLIIYENTRDKAFTIRLDQGGQDLVAEEAIGS